MSQKARSGGGRDRLRNARDRAALAPTGTPLSGPTTLKQNLTTTTKLWKHVGALASSSALLLFLSQVGTDRLSLTQAAFFLAAATADAAGKPATRSALIQAAMGDAPKTSIKNSYRQLLEPSRVYPKALGWLTTEENPDDAREQLLRLTPEGQRAIEGVLLALEPLVRTTEVSVN